jgi:hypothetical protein
MGDFSNWRTRWVNLSDHPKEPYPSGKLTIGLKRPTTEPIARDGQPGASWRFNPRPMNRETLSLRVFSPVAVAAFQYDELLI